MLLVVVVGGGGLWVRGQVAPGSPGEEVPVEIPVGSSTAQIADQLEREGIITSAAIFGWYVRLKGGGPFQAGEYEGLRRNSSMGDVLAILERGPAPPRTRTFLIREGLWISEVRAEILEQFPEISPDALDAVLRSTHPALQPEGSENLEGFLFPATYEIALADVGNPQIIVDKMLEAFERVSTAEGLPSAESSLAGVAGRRVITPYDALIVASMVESEARTDEDRPKIARVIYNRLAQGMSLGIDATVLYAIQQRKETITSRDLQFDSPYNTRLKVGMPPTPINSPGQASINAAMNPADGDWLYYVLYDTDGSHYFTNSYSDFQRAVADARARGIF